MIEIMCEGGHILAEVNMSYSIMCHLLQDGVIREYDFVEIEFADGAHGMVRKKSIIGFYESEGNTQV